MLMTIPHAKSINKSMDRWILFVGAFIAGGLIALQAALNSQLGSLLGHVKIASCSVFLTATLTMLLLVGTSSYEQWPTLQQFTSIPRYLWIVGGVVSALALSCVYWIIPKVGAGSGMATVLAGQLVMSAIIGHFGLFDLPANALNPMKIVGLITLLFGMGLVIYE